ncbi:hypothetical protein Tco_1238894 [Tanacetum coccineum]
MDTTDFTMQLVGPTITVHIYPEYIPLEDEHEFSAKEQPLPPVVSPTAKSPGYDEDDDDGDSSRDDADDEGEDEGDEDDEDEEEEVEHLDLADSAIDDCRLSASISLHQRNRLQDEGSTRDSEVGYGIRDTWVDPAEAVPKVAPMTVGEINTRVTELTELHERDTQDLYALLRGCQDDASTSDTAIAAGYSYSDTALGKQRARQPGLDARIPDHQDASGDADSHI